MPGPFPDDERSALRGMSRCSRNLRRLELHAPTFCAITLTCVERDRQPLLDRQRRAVDRQRVAELHHVVPGANGPVTMTLPATVACGVEPSSIPGPRAVRQLEDQRLGGCTGAARRSRSRGC